MDCMRTLILCLTNTGLMVTGQILFKLGSRGKSIDGLSDIIRLFFSPIIFCALCLYAATTGLWLYILSKTPLSYAYPIQALAFPVVLLLSALLFHEQITLQKMMGVLLIVIGVFVATKG